MPAGPFSEPDVSLSEPESSSLADAVSLVEGTATMTVGDRFCFFRGLGDSCRPSSFPSSGDNSGLSDLRLRLVRGGLLTGGGGT